jgi:type IV secretion system protein VirB5
MKPFSMRALLGSVAVVGLLSVSPARAQTPVIDVSSIAKILDLTAVQQQQLTQLVATYNQTVGIYNQAIQIVNQAKQIYSSVSGLTNANSWASILQTPTLQNPLPFSTNSQLPGILSGTTSASTLPNGQTYLNQFGQLPQDLSTVSTDLRTAANFISSIESVAHGNLSALETRAAALPTITNQISAASTVQQTAAISARLQAEQAFVSNQQAQSQNLLLAAQMQVATAQQVQQQRAVADRTAAVGAACSSVTAASASGITVAACGGPSTGAGTTTVASTGTTP